MKNIFTTAILVMFLIIQAAYSDEKPQVYKSIRVVVDNNYPPYIFKNSSGDLQGIIIDQWKLFEKKTKIKVIISAMDWSDALKHMDNKKADVIDTIFYNEERGKKYIFSKPYTRISVPVFFHKDINGISNIESLQGYSIGVKNGDSCIDILSNNGINTLIKYNSYEDIIKSAKNNEIRIFCIDMPPALYYLNKMKMSDDYRQSLNLYTGYFHRAVHKNNHDLLKILDNGFNMISEKENNKIISYWTGRELPKNFNYQLILYAMLITLIIMLNLIYFNYLLRKRIKQKTIELKKSITNLSQSEDQTKAIIAAIPDLLYVITKNGIFLDYKTSADDLIAITENDVVGKNIDDMPFPEDIKAITKEKINESLASKKVIIYTYKMMVDSTLRHFESRIVPYGEDKVLSISRDITDSVKKDEQLLQAQKMETIGNIAGGLAHDFNNILGGIIGNTSLLKYRIKNEYIEPNDIYDDINTIETISKRGSDIVNQLLTLSRNQELSLKTIDLTRTIKYVISICRKTFDKSVDIVFENNDDFAFTNADPIRIEQALLNIAINSYHAMTIMRNSGEKSGGILNISLTQIIADEQFCKIYPKFPEGKYWKIKISDNGVGIDSAILNKIFDPFFSTKKKLKGSGLGLTMVYKIIEQHGGLTNVTSSTSSGTVFEVYLPAAQYVVQETEQSDVDLQVDGEGTILIIDDEDMIIDTAVKMLTICGFTTICARDGEEGIAMYKENMKDISLVLLDMSMPKLSGYETFYEIRKINNNSKIVIMSGYGNDDRVIECLNDGADGFLQKPWTLDELITKVSKTLANNPK